jgi:glucose-1-phosphate thymidylyltransferase
MARGIIVVDGRTAQRGGPSWAPQGPALAPVANRPLIAHAIDTLRGAGAEEVAVVADRSCAALLRDALRGDPASRRPLRWLELDAPVGEGEGILAAADHIEGGRFLLHRADGLALGGGDALRRALAEPACDAAVAFRRRAAHEPAALRSPGRPGRRTARLLGGVAADRLELDGIQAFGPGILDALRSVEPAPGGERGLLDAVERLAGEGDRRVCAGWVDGWWRYSGLAQDLLDVNREALDSIEPLTPADLPGCRIEGRVRVHPEAEVTGSALRGPVIIGAGARIVDAYVGPFTSVGEGASIENAEIEGSMVLPGARLSHLGVRVEGSIVGRGAAVTRDFRLPRALRLLVGEGARVTLS